MNQNLKKYCLIESIDDVERLPEEYIYVPLNIHASYFLRKNNIKHVLLEDYYKTQDIYGDTDGYLVSEQEWFQSLGCIVATELGIDLSYPNIVDLLSLVFRRFTDLIVYTARMLKYVFEKLKPSSIIHIKAKPDNISNQLWFESFDGETNFACIVPLVCKQLAIPYESLFSSNNWSKVDVNKSFKDYFRNYTPSIIKEKYRLSYRKKEIQSRLKPAVSQSDKVMFFFNPRAHLVEKLCEVVKTGALCYVLIESSVYKVTLNGLKKISSIRDKKKIRVSKNNITKIKNNINFNWIIKEAANCPVENIFFSAFDYYLKEIIPSVLALSNNYKDLFSRLAINEIYFYALANIHDFSAHHAILNNKGIRSFGYLHGVDAFKYDCRYFNEFRLFDEYQVATNDEKKYILHCKEKYKAFSFGKLNNFEQGDYLKNNIFKNKKRQQNNLTQAESSNNLILFVPLMRQLFHEIDIADITPLTLVFEKWHWALLDYFSQQKNHTFVWKAYMQPGVSFSSIKDYIKCNNIENVVFDTGNIFDWYEKTDKVIQDIPSTSYFESIYLKKDVLCFYHDDFQELCGNAGKVRAQSLRKFVSIGNALKEINEFLYSNENSIDSSNTNKELFPNLTEEII